MSDQPNPSKGSLFTVNSVSTKGVEKQLARIADCLEIIIRYEYGHNVTVPKPIEGGGKVEDEVSYSSDKDTFRNDLEESIRALPDEVKDELL